MDTVVTYLILSFIVSFLLGSIPWGVIVSKLAFHKDIREEGSGNIGTTNAFRAMGKAGGAVVFLLDFGKGVLSGWLAAWVFAPAIAGVAVDGTAAEGQALLAAFGPTGVNPVSLCLALAFAGCTLGHIFSPWLKFHGGKGIAVAAACLLFVYGPVGFFIEIAVFALGILITRCVSVGSIAAAVSALRACYAPCPPIEVECRTAREVGEAVAARPERILLDNMDAGRLSEVLPLIPRSIEAEISGGVSLANIRELALACPVRPADFISVGRITHSAPVADFSMKMERRAG